MKRLHRPDLFGWSEFNEERNIDFHSIIWVRKEGNVIIDPVPFSIHDQNHLDSLGKVAYIIITNSDHIRTGESLANVIGAELLGPQQEQKTFPFQCAQWLQEGDEIIPDLEIFELEGSKTPGELALLLEKTTLITGDLIRAHEGGKLCILPADKLSNQSKAIESVKRLASISTINAVLPGDGWPVFRNAQEVLKELVDSL